MTRHTLDPQIVQDVDEFLQTWCEDDIARLAQRYPSEQTVLEVDYGDLRRGLPDLALDYLDESRYVQDHLDEALQQYHLPIEIDLSKASVRLTNVARAAEQYVHDVGSYLPGEVADQFTLVRGQVVKRTQPTLRPTKAIWECDRCGCRIEYPQPRDAPMRDPHECPDCERQGLANSDELIMHETDEGTLELIPPSEIDQQPPRKPHQQD